MKKRMGVSFVGSLAVPEPKSMQERITQHQRGDWLIGPVLYPNLYLWFVLLAMADVLFTWTIISNGGYEANAFASWIMEQYGMSGAVVLKFAAVVWVLCVCEFVGRRKETLALRLAEWCVALNAVPVVVGLVMMYVQAGH